MRTAFALLACAVACGCGSPDLSGPLSPAQGNGNLLSANPAVLVSPDESNAWIPHGGNLLAVDTRSGSISSVYSIAGLSDLRMAFFENGIAILLATDPAGCPFATTACTRFVRIHTDTLTTDSIDFEGSTFRAGQLSLGGTLIALTGGIADEGAYLVDSTGVPELLHWSAAPSALGWSRCPSGCDERLWIVAGAKAESWPVTGGQIATAPDLSLDLVCGKPYYGLGMPAVAASPSGQYVALSCANGNFTLYDALTGVAHTTEHRGPVAFAYDGTTLVGHDAGDFDGDNDVELCLLLIDAETLLGSPITCNLSQYRFYVSQDGQSVLIDGYSSFYSPNDTTNSHIFLYEHEFAERPGHEQVWVAVDGSLVEYDFGNGEFSDLRSTRVDHLNILPMQDRLALLASDSELTLTFFSMVTNSAQLVVPIP